MKKDVEMMINKIANEVIKKVYSKQNISKMMSNPNVIQDYTLRMLESRAYHQFAKKFSKELTKRGLSGQKGIWRKYFEQAKRRGIVAIPQTFVEFEKGLFQNISLKNFELIKSIPIKILHTIQQKGVEVLLNQVVTGKLPRGSFEKYLRDRNSVNAKLIARTETAKIQTAITQYRSVNLGSVCYIWSSTKDVRTRQSHKDMNGVLVFWRQNDLEKPYLDGMYGNAGEFPNCRCGVMPVFDEEDIQGSSIKWYDYTKQKIVLSRRDVLLKKIENEIKRSQREKGVK